MTECMITFPAPAPAILVRCNGTRKWLSSKMMKATRSAGKKVFANNSSMPLTRVSS